MRESLLRSSKSLEKRLEKKKNISKLLDRTCFDKPRKSELYKKNKRIA